MTTNQEQPHCGVSRQPARIPQLSVVIPAYNEAGNLPSLIAALTAAFNTTPQVELIVVDDGSEDHTQSCLTALQRIHPHLRTERHDRRQGQGLALLTGLHAARGDWIITCDADGQVPPEAAARLWQLASSRADTQVMLVGKRRRRRDGGRRILLSRLGNGLRRLILQEPAWDAGCGTKCFTTTLGRSLPVVHCQHWFLPSLAYRAGASVRSIPVKHRPRRNGRSNYRSLGSVLEHVLGLVQVWSMNEPAPASRPPPIRPNGLTRCDKKPPRRLAQRRLTVRVPQPPWKKRGC